MNERLPLVAVFNENDLEKINNFLKNISTNLCKVPFGKKVDNCRFEVDALPYHMTIFSWSIKRLEEVKSILSTISFNPIEVLVENIQIVEGNDDSLELQFAIAENEELKKIQEQLLIHFSSQVFNPSTYIFHITIHISKNKEEIYQLEKNLQKNFRPFKLTIDTLKLFSIYPAIIIEEYHANI